MAVFRMARPMRRERSSKEQFRVRIPADVLVAARGQSLVLTVGDAKVPKTIGPKAVEIGCSLRTNDPSEVKLRQAEVLRQVETFFVGLRQKRAPVALTLEECVRLAGDFYRGWTTGGPDTGLQGLEAEELEAVWQAAERRLGEALDRGPERAVPGLRKMAERFLLGRGLAVDEPTLDKLCAEIVKAIRDAAKTNARKAGGDFSEGDPLAKRFGEPWRQSAAKGKDGLGSKRKPAALTFNRLIAMWRDDPQVAPAPSTVASYGKSFELLAKMVGHDDPARLSHEDIQRLKDARLKVVSPRTVKNNDLAGIRSVLQWAIDEGHLPGPNPARDVKVKMPKGAKARSRTKRHDPNAGPGLTDGEALAVLRAALRYERTNPQEKAKTAAAKRWVPWLMAYTGTRVGEMAQLRKEDVRQHERGFWYVVLSPDAGTIKTGVENFVPLHSHLVELGFIEFVKRSAEGHLFLDPQPEGGHEAGDQVPKLNLKPGFARKAGGQVAMKGRGTERKSAFSRTDDPRGILGPLNGLKNRLREFARETVTDTAVQPQHGWRHRFKPWAMDAIGMHARMANEIQGHASGGADGETRVSSGYGMFTVEQRHEAVERLPRYEV